MLVNPFDLVYDKLIELTSRSAAVKNAIGENVISENSEDDVLRWEGKTKESELPDIRLNHSTIGGNLNLASNAAQIDREYNWLIRTENKTLSRSIHRIEWALLCALVDQNYDTTLRQLEWPIGHRFVKNVAMVSFASGDMDTERTGLAGWAAVCTIRLAMIFPQSSMRQFSLGDVLTPVTV
jgi:hypothetical protein